MNHTNLRKALGLGLSKTLAVVTSLALLVPFMAPAAYAGPAEDVTSKYFGTLAVSGIKQGGAVASTGNGSAGNPFTSTTTVIMNLSYSGTAASAAITVASSCITFYAPVGTVDTGIGSATCGFTGGTFDMSVSTGGLTLGQLCDLINGVQGPFSLSGNANGGAPTGGNYHCTLVGGIRSDTSANYLPTVTQAANVNNLNAVGGYSIPTSTAQIVSLGIIPAAGRHVVLNSCTVNTSGTPPLQVFGSLAKFGVGANGFDSFGNPLTDASLAWLSPALVANTTTNEPLATIVSNPWLEFSGGGAYNAALNVPAGHAPSAPVGNAYNGHVVARVNNYALNAAAEASTNFVSCQWNERSN